MTACVPSTHPDTGLTAGPRHSFMRVCLFSRRKPEPRQEEERALHHRVDRAGLTGPSCREPQMLFPLQQTGKGRAPSGVRFRTEVGGRRRRSQGRPPLDIVHKEARDCGRHLRSLRAPGVNRELPSGHGVRHGRRPVTSTPPSTGQKVQESREPDARGRRRNPRSAIDRAASPPSMRKARASALTLL
jgi:hypothetical protein